MISIPHIKNEVNSSSYTWIFVMFNNFVSSSDSNIKLNSKTWSKDDIAVLGEDNDWHKMAIVDNHYRSGKGYKIYGYGFPNSELPTTTRFGDRTQSSTSYRTQTVTVQAKHLYKVNNEYISSGNDKGMTVTDLGLYNTSSFLPSGYTIHQISTTDPHYADLSLSSVPSLNIAEDSRTITNGDLNIKATMYDYFSNYELITGFDKYTLSNSTDANFNDSNGYGWDSKGRRRVPTYYFNKLMSSIYENYQIAKPMYFGSFSSKDSVGHAESDFYRLYDSNDKTRGRGPDCYAENLDSNGNLYLGNTINSTVPNAKVPFFDKNWLTSNKVGNYVDTTFPFFKDSSGYYIANSDSWAYRVIRDNGQVGISAIPYNLSDNNNLNNRFVVNGTETASSGGIKKTRGDFFPFSDPRSINVDNNYYLDRMNYGFGMELEIPFKLTSTKQITNSGGTLEDIVFEFKGDDDMVVYIDNYLVMDLGGTHDDEDGSINFRTGQIIDNNGTTTSSSESTFVTNLAANTEHIMKIFYVERGLWESNMKIRFNMPIEKSLQVEKEVAADINTNLTTANANITANLAKLAFPIDMQLGNNPSNLNDMTISGGGTYTAVDKNNQPISSPGLIQVTSSNGTASVSGANRHRMFLADGDKAAYTKAIESSDIYYARIKERSDTNQKYYYLDNNRALHEIPNKKNIGMLFDTSWQFYSDTHSAVLTASDTNNGPAQDTAHTGYFEWSGTIQNPNKVKFINTLKTQTITVTKQADNNTPIPYGTVFTFNVVLDNVGGIGLEESTFTGSNDTNTTITIPATITFGQNNNQAVIDKIPVGTSYTITEQTDSNYTPTYLNNTGIVGNEAVSVAVTNTAASVDPDIFTLEIITKWLATPENWANDTLERVAYHLEYQKSGETAWHNVASVKKWIDPDATVALTDGKIVLNKTEANILYGTSMVNAGPSYTTWRTSFIVDKKIEDSFVTYRITEYTLNGSENEVQGNGVDNNYAESWKATYSDTSAEFTGVGQSVSTEGRSNGQMIVVNTPVPVPEPVTSTGGTGKNHMPETAGILLIGLVGTVFWGYSRKMRKI